MPNASSYINPTTVLSRPFEWTELSLSQAMLRRSFMPVVSVYRAAYGLQAEVLQNACYASTPYGPYSPTARFFTQVARNSSTAAESMVPKVMDLSSEGADFIQGWESTGGYDKAKNLYFPYDDKDPHHKPLGDRTAKGFPTIGYGHLIVLGEDYAKGLTLEQVKALFLQDTASRIKKLNKHLTVGVSQTQFDALFALAFNVGNAITPPIKHLNAGKAVVQQDFTSHYITSKGVVMQGLVKRRKSEWVLFSKGVYDSSH